MTSLGSLGALGTFFISFGLFFVLGTGDIVGSLIFALVFLVVYLSVSIRVIIQYDRAVLFRLGKYITILNPGFHIIFPWVERIQRVTLRIQVADVPPQEIISKDNIPLNINAVAYYKVGDPKKAVIDIENYQLATFQIAQTVLRNIIGQFEMDEVLQQRDKINHQIQEIIDKDTDEWGVKVTLVEIKDVELPQNLKRAMAKQAEAERERRARVILATGELEASEKLTQAGNKIASEPAALQLRLLQTIQEISVEKNSTILFPLPIELMHFIEKVSK